MFNSKLSKRVSDLEERADKGFAFYDERLNNVAERHDARITSQEQRIVALSVNLRAFPLDERLEAIESRISRFENAVENLTGMVTALQAKLHEPGLFSRMAELQENVEGCRKMFAAESAFTTRLRNDVVEHGMLLESHSAKLRNVPDDLIGKLERWLEISLSAKREIEELIEATGCHRRTYPYVPAVPEKPQITKIERIRREK